MNVYLCVYVIAPHHHQWHSCICNTITFPSYRTRHLNCSCDERHLTRCFHFHFCIWAWALMTVKPNAQHGVKQNSHQCLIQPAFIIAAVLMPQWLSGHTLDHSCAGWMITSLLRPLLNSMLHWDQTERPVFVTHALYLTFTEHLLFL